MKSEILHPAALLLFLSGCTFLPATSEDQSYADRCEMLTKKLTLTSEYFDLHHGQKMGSDPILRLTPFYGCGAG